MHKNRMGYCNMLSFRKEMAAFVSLLAGSGELSVAKLCQIW